MVRLTLVCFETAIRRHHGGGQLGCMMRRLTTLTIAQIWASSPSNPLMGSQQAPRSAARAKGSCEVQAKSCYYVHGMSGEVVIMTVCCGLLTVWCLSRTRDRTSGHPPSAPRPSTAPVAAPVAQRRSPQARSSNCHRLVPCRCRHPQSMKPVTTSREAVRHEQKVKSRFRVRRREAHASHNSSNKVKHAPRAHQPQQRQAQFPNMGAKRVTDKGACRCWVGDRDSRAHPCWEGAGLQKGSGQQGSSKAERRGTEG